MEKRKELEEDMRRPNGRLKPYEDVLRDASFLFEEKVEELSLLKRIGDLTHYIFDQEVIFRKFVDVILEETNAENCSFMLMDTDTDRLVLKMARGRNEHGTFFEQQGDPETTFSLGEGIAGTSALEKITILINDVREDKRFDTRETRFPIGSLLCTPLIFQEKVLGVINLSHTRPYAFSQNNKRVMELLCAFISSFMINAVDYIRIRDQEKFVAMFKGIKLPILLIDSETGKIVDCNEHAEKWLGYSKGEFASMEHAFDILCPECKEEVSQILQGILDEDDSSFHELSFVKKDASNMISEVNGTMISYQERNVVQLTIRDVTEQRKAQEELRITKDYLDNIIKSSLDPIVITDNRGHLTRANKSFFKLLDYREEEVIGKHIAEFSPLEKGTYESSTGSMIEIDEEFFTGAKRMVSILVDEQKVHNHESYLICNDRKVIPVEESIVYLYNQAGDTTGAVGIIRDITERKMAEGEIKEARDFLENIFKTSADGIVITDAEGNITMLNNTVEKMLGYSTGELTGKHLMELSPVSEHYKEESNEFIKKLFEEGVVTGFERTWVKKDGSLVDIEISAALLKDSEGNRTGSVASIRDISERKEIEHKLLQSEKLKSLGELAGGVAHDFNNVLAAILGRAQLLKMIVETPPEKEERRKSVIELKEGLEIIEKASRDGAETVRRIQEFARRRDDDKYFTSVDINEIVDNALEFTRMKWKDNAESQGIKINIKKELSTLPITSGSAAELREVLTNLINNAVDAMPQGGEIKIKTYQEDTHITIKVEDTGVGIPRALRDRIFDPFFTTKGVKSTGLGMSVSYGIINRHHGTISVDSTEGEETTFTIKLPISEKVIEEEKVRHFEDEAKKARILVIEDEEPVRNLLSDILKKGGHKVEVVSDGNQGIEVFKEKAFDLVFTDLGIPGMSGWQVAEKVKSINGRVPVILITGWNVELRESENKGKWVDLIIHKPFELDRVLNIVQEGMILKERFKAT